MDPMTPVSTVQIIPLVDGFPDFERSTTFDGVSSIELDLAPEVDDSFLGPLTFEPIELTTSVTFEAVLVGLATGIYGARDCTDLHLMSSRSLARIPGTAAHGAVLGSRMQPGDDYFPFSDREMRVVRAHLEARGLRLRPRLFREGIYTVA